MTNPVSCRCSVIKGKRKGGDPPPVSAHSPGPACGGGQSDLTFPPERADVGIEEPLGQTAPSPSSSSLCHRPIHSGCVCVCLCVCECWQRGARPHTPQALSLHCWGRMSLQLRGRWCQEDGDDGRISELMRAALDGFWGRGSGWLQTREPGGRSQRWGMEP